jgi:signal transduction histidine kinase
MDTIMDTLLAAARRELGSAVGRCELQPVFDELARDRQALTISTAAHGLSVGVDRDVVTRILSPILENARRYAATSIHVAAHRVDGRVLVEISNDGERIPAGATEAIFEPGFRTGGPDDHDGAGLGLALARRLARSADGELSVDAASAQTTFQLVLPAG